MNTKSSDNITLESLKDKESQYLTFLLEGELYGIGILSIKEIKEYNGITRIPMMPDFISGVINLRGNVVPVIDLNIRFGRKKTNITKKTCIIIIEIEESKENILDIGVIVDSVNEVISISSSNIEQAPSFGTKIRLDFIQGIGKVEDKFIILLNILKVFSIEELSQITNTTKSV